MRYQQKKNSRLVLIYTSKLIPVVKALSTLLSTAALDKNRQSRERGITMDLGFSSFITKPPPRLQQKGLQKQLGVCRCQIITLVWLHYFADGVYYDDLQFTLVTTNSLANFLMKTTQFSYDVVQYLGGLPRPRVVNQNHHRRRTHHRHDAVGRGRHKGHPNADR